MHSKGRAATHSKGGLQHSKGGLQHIARVDNGHSNMHNSYSYNHTLTLLILRKEWGCNTARVITGLSSTQYSHSCDHTPRIYQ